MLSNKILQKIVILFSFFILTIVWIWTWNISITNNITWNWNTSSQFFQKNNNLWENKKNFDITKITNLELDLIVWPDAQSKVRFFDFLKKQNFLNGRIYLISDKNIKSELKKTNIPIRIITEWNQYMSYQNNFKSLIDYFLPNQNIKIVKDDRLWVNFNHTKTFFWDVWFVIQTANLSHSSYSLNKEHFVFGQDIDILKNLNYIFESDWTWNKIDIDKIHPNLVICPIDCRIKIESLLQNANSSIFVYQQYIKDPNIQKIIWQKINDGLDVRIIVPSTNKDNQKLVNLRSPKIVKLLKKPYIHSKSFLIDQKYLVISSANFSTNSLDNNREIWIISINNENIKLRKDDFLKNW